MKACTDCQRCKVPYKYHPGELGGWSEKFYDRAMCTATVDYVTGHGDGHRRCSEERSDATGCGPGAVNFLPFPPRPPRPPRKRGWFERLFA